MTLKYMEGFETCRDDTDFRARGWLLPAGTAFMRAAFPPSSTSITGTALQPIGVGSAGTGNPGTSGAQDVGYFNTGVTANAAWNAGGFTLGFSGRFNVGAAYSYASGGNNAIAFPQIAYDPVNKLYWAYRFLISSAASGLYTSPDLINWTPSPVVPATLSTLGGIYYVGNGTIAVIGNSSAAVVQNVYTTNNNGASWTTTTLTTTHGSGLNSGATCATGNSTYPHVAITTNQVAATAGGIYVGTYGGTITNPVSFTATSTSVSPVMKIAGPFLIGLSSNSSTTYFLSALTANDISASANWSTANTSNNIGYATDAMYVSASNVFVVTTSSGIWTVPAGGTSGSPTPPTGSVAGTQRYSTAAMASIFLVGSTYYAVGAAGHIVTSPDCVTWTETAGHLLTVGGSYAWRRAIYDGSQYVLVSDYTSGVVAVTPDLSTNYTVKYVMDGTENNQTSTNNGNLGILASAPPTSGTAWSALGNLVGIYVGPVSSASRKVALVSTSVAGGDSAAAVTLSTATTLVHYYEIVATAVAGTTNAFTAQLYVDGTLIGKGTSTYTLGSGTSDTTSVMIINWGRMNSISTYDDMYFCVNDGVGISGPQGVINIVARRPTTDVQAVWTKTGSAASNSLSVNQPALSSLSTNYVSSSNSGDKDIYSSSQTLPVGYLAKAVQLEAAFTKTSTTSPVVNLGVISGSTESDGVQTTLVTQGAPYIVTQVVDRDPNGNVAWTNTTANASQFVINHVT